MSEHDETLETWLRTEGAAAYDELKAVPSIGRTPEQVLASLKALETALIEGEESGEPEPFDNEAFKAQMRAE